MKQIRLANKIIKTLIKDRIYYPSRLIADILVIAARCGVLLILYWYVFRLNNGIINNTIFSVAAWSMFFYFAFSVLQLRYISRMIMQDVQSGNVEILLNKPVSYLWYKMWWQIGLGLYSFLIISVIGIIALGLIIGFPETMANIVFILTIIPVILLGIILNLFLYSIIGLLAFWIEDIDPIFWIVDKMVMILGGSYLPVALFPDFMYKAALYSPFGASFFITHTVYQTWVTEWAMKIGIQIFWIIIVSIITFLLFSRARKKVSINGG